MLLMWERRNGEGSDLYATFPVPSADTVGDYNTWCLRILPLEVAPGVVQRYRLEVCQHYIWRVLDEFGPNELVKAQLNAAVIAQQIIDTATQAQDLPKQ